MSKLHIEVSEVIDAPVEAVYAVIADYRDAHQAILPRPYFQEMTIVQGGHGAGTETRLTMRVWGQTFHYHQMVTEPEPGRIIEERDLEADQVTRFYFEPVDDGQHTRVTIASDFPVAPGVAGVMQRMTQPSIIRQLYRKELANLQAYLHGQPIPA
ncbi:MAG: SRPBCC family protein [Anaerolineae bacterium]|nr:SRPBCC family protein [Anaerolineae bacterium]